MKLTFPIVAMLGSILMAGYLYLTDQLTRELAFILFGIVMIAFFLYFRYEKPYITYQQAREIAMREAIVLQKKGELPAGTLIITPETGRKDIIMPTPEGTKIEPRKWVVGIKVEGKEGMKGFFMDIGAFGDILETSENDEPTRWRVYEIDDLRRVGGYLPTPEESETGAYERQERSKDERERIRDRKTPRI